MSNQRRIGDIEDYYGYYWEEIPESLYNALVGFEDNRLSKISQ